MNRSVNFEQESPEPGEHVFQAQRSTDPDQAYEQAKRVLHTLAEAGYRARFAGGCVRDRCLGLRPKDYDIATEARPEVVSTLFKQKGIKTVPTGIDHGTVTVVYHGQGIEVTTLRKDVETDGRRAKVVFGSSFVEDAQRRDFTINAMFEDLQGRVYDAFGGFTDLQHKILRFVGHPASRIREDYLRILRFFRFLGRFQLQVAPGTEAAVAAGVGGLKDLSQERVTSEWLQILANQEVGSVLELMSRTGVLQPILGFACSGSLLASLEPFAQLAPLERPVARMAALLREAPQELAISDYLVSLRLSGRMVQRILSLLALPRLTTYDRAGQMEAIDRMEKVWGRELDQGLLALELLFPQATLPAELTLCEQSWAKLRKTRLPIHGHDLQQALGLSPGAELGSLRENLQRAFRNGEWHTREEGMALARTWVLPNLRDDR